MKFVFALMMTVMAGVAYAAQPVFPDRPVRIIVPFPPGGGSDLVARLLALKMPEVLGQNGVVDNRAGAAGLLGTQMVANAPNDGYTLLLADTPFAVNQEIYSKPGYDPLKSFAIVSQVATTPMILVVNLTVAAMTTQEFIALAKAQPGKLAISNGGIGSIAHLASRLFMINTGIEMTTIQYKGGAPALIGMMSGEAQANVAPAPVAMPQIRSGKVRALGVASAIRSVLAPELPTLLETGVKDFVVANWYVVAVPFGTPAPVVARLHAAILKILDQPDSVARLSAALIEKAPSASPRAAHAMIETEMKNWARIVKASNIKVE